ncbi:MAG TPA: hypothetical protein VGR45_11100 [Stellaceae bacterium]|nr:hypothetical protein [Stellaceae bacterium]
MQTPAVVLGADINGLGVVRSLAREGVPTYLVDSDRADPTMRTRYPVKVIFRSLAGPGVIDDLLELRRSFAHDPVLLLTQEGTVETVSAALGRVASGYRISMPDAVLMRRLMDKARFQALAQDLGFAIPGAAHLRSANDLAGCEALRYPCVLKPVVKTAAYQEQCLKKAYRIENAAQLCAVFREIDGAAEMIVQEWIEGSDDQIYFCLQYRSQDQRTVISFAGRKLRSWPPQTGGTASCAPAPPEHREEITRITDAFFAMVGFFGIGSMEFKRDARTGQFLMIEPTVGRTDFQEEVATLNGVNIPYAAYCCELGRAPPPPRHVPREAAWVGGPIDRWSAELQPQRRRDFPAGLRRYDALWRAADPLPWCATIGKRAANRIASLGRPGR